MTAQSMGIRGRDNRCLQKSVVLIHSHESLYDEGHETEVCLRRVARGMA